MEADHVAPKLRALRFAWGQEVLRTRESWRPASAEPLLLEVNANCKMLDARIRKAKGADRDALIALRDGQSINAAQFTRLLDLLPRRCCPSEVAALRDA